MKASEIIKEKLLNCGGEATIRQLNGNLATIYFVTPQTFWSNRLNKQIADGYDFRMFDILESESYRFPNRIMPKGNARNFKLGDFNCDMDTAIGILGYKYYNKNDGESLFEPMHVIAAVLDWAGVAKNERGYIMFLK
jgi:hypothetical protein